MENELRRISITPGSDLAILIKQTVAAGEAVVVETGEETYRVEVRAMPASPSSDALRHLGRQLAGSLATVDTPGWESSDAAEAWVDNLRQADTYSFPAPSHP
jgi:hypothetical protein